MAKCPDAEAPEYQYTVHVTETVELQCTITSKRKLTYAQIMHKAEEIRVEGNLDELGVSDVAMRLDDAKPGPCPVALPTRREMREMVRSRVA